MACQVRFLAGALNFIRCSFAGDAYGPPIRRRKFELVFEKLLVPSIAPCSLGMVLQTLDQESRTNLEAALALPNSAVSHNRIVREVFDETELKLSPETVSAHRKGECRCSRI